MPGRTPTGTAGTHSLSVTFRGLTIQATGWGLVLLAFFAVVCAIVLGTIWR